MKSNSEGMILGKRGFKFVQVKLILLRDGLLVNIKGGISNDLNHHCDVEI